MTLFSHNFILKARTHSLKYLHSYCYIRIKSVKQNFQAGTLGKRSCSDKRIAGGGGDAAHVVLVPGDLHIAVVAPGGVPQPVGGAGVLIDAVADSQNTVVEVFGAAFLIPVDALAVELERLVAGIDGNTARTLGGKSSLQSMFVTLLNINKANVPGALVMGVVTARVVLSLVRVGLLSVDASVVLDVLEGGVHEPTVAALVAVLAAAVDQVLLGEADQVAGRPVVHRLESSRRGEAPAGAALALVLHRRHRPVLPPVHVLGQGGDVGRGQVLGPADRHLGPGVVELGAHLVAVHDGGELMVQQVAELVHGKVVV